MFLDYVIKVWGVTTAGGIKLVLNYTGTSKSGALALSS